MAKRVAVRVMSPTGDPTKGAEDIVLTGADQNVQNLDIRDRLSELIGRGNSLRPDDKASIYGSLTAALGKDKATKIMQHAYIFNQRPDVLQLPLEDKLKAFYTIGSGDKDVNDVITKSRSLGYGVLPGFRESSSYRNQVLAGRTPDLSVTGVDPEIQKRVLLRVNK